MDPLLLEVIVCPACRGELKPSADLLSCAGCGLRYPVRDDIPILLIDEAFHACGACGARPAKVEGTAVVCPSCGAREEFPGLAAAR